VIPIRNTKSFQQLCRLAATLALNAYFILIREFLPSNLDELKQKYLADGQRPFRALFPENAFPEIAINQIGK
jgi:hypothetical protein